MNSPRALLSPPLFLMLLLAICPSTAAHAQQSQVPTYFPPNSGISNSNPNAASNRGPLERRMAERMAVERNKERQKQMEKESTELVALARRLNADLANSIRARRPKSVRKEAAKIEKLAKSIKNKMSYGY